MGSRDTRLISWIKAARKAFEGFPKGARDEILRALTAAAEGRKLDIAKPMNLDPAVARQLAGGK